MQTEIADFLAPYQQLFDHALRDSLSSLGPDNLLREACAYSLLSDGKRFRPALVLMIARSLNGSQDCALKAALAVEYFHTASLIADDLPCMDNEEERRGKKTLHRVFGEANALLATYALIAAGYAAIGEASDFVSAEACRSALQIAAENSGLKGLIGGQFLDLTPPDRSTATLIAVMRQKTASLFDTAFGFGWLFGKGDPNLLGKVREAANHFGIAFQLADDLDDKEKDLALGRVTNFANCFGREAAETMFYKELALFRSKIKLLQLECLQPLAVLLEKFAQPGLSVK